MLLFRFERVMPWSDASFNWHLMLEEERVLPRTLEGEERPMLEILLIQANGGRLAAMRHVSMSPEFGRALHEAIRRQVESEGNEQKHLQEVGALLGAYPSSERLLDLATV